MSGEFWFWRLDLFKRGLVQVRVIVSSKLNLFSVAGESRYTRAASDDRRRYIGRSSNVDRLGLKEEKISATKVLNT